MSSSSITDLERELAEARAEIERLQSEFSDLQLMYEGTIEHGEEVEDELAEKNLLLQTTQRRLEQELAEAAGYVLSILPPPRTELPLTDWLLIPSTELGGDSFGYHDIGDDHLAFYLLDVCGHGIGAALLSVTAINVLRSSALPDTDFRDPSAVLAALNTAFPMERQNNAYFTTWYGVYCRSTQELRYASAGHPPAVHLRGTPGAKVEVRELVTWGLATGTFPDVRYDSEVLQIEPGDRLILLSDGTFEVSAPGGDMLPFSDFVGRLAEPGGDDPRQVLAWVRGLTGGSTLPDDFSYLRIQF